MHRLMMVVATTVLGYAAPDLPMEAAHALTRGLDSPTLREVAGLGPADPARELFGAALRELGAEWPDAPAAHLLLAKDVAGAVLSAQNDIGELCATVHFHLCYTDVDRGRWLELHLAWDSTQPGAPERRIIAEEIRTEVHALLSP